MDKNKKQSFTLIEILVVTTITILLSGFSIVMLSSYKDDRALNTQVSYLIQAISLAKSKARAGDTMLCSDSSTAYVDGYSVVVNPTAIQIVPGCDTSPSPVVYAIQPNIVFVTPSFALQFNSHNYVGNTVTIPIKQTTTNRCKFVQIDETGLVTNGDYTCP